MYITQNIIPDATCYAQVLLLQHSSTVTKIKRIRHVPVMQESKYFLAFTIIKLLLKLEKCVEYSKKKS